MRGDHGIHVVEMPANFLSQIVDLGEGNSFMTVFQEPGSQREGQALSVRFNYRNIRL
jgi:hypothetical protein